MACLRFLYKTISHGFRLSSRLPTSPAIPHPFPLPTPVWSVWIRIRVFGDFNLRQQTGTKYALLTLSCGTLSGGLMTLEHWEAHWRPARRMLQVKCHPPLCL